MSQLKKEVAGYALVGALATIVDAGMLYAMTEYVHLYYLFSNILAFTLGLLTNYVLSVRYVFTTRRLKNQTLELVIFATIGIFGLAINTLLLWSLTQFIGLFYMVSKAIAVVVVFIVNFGLRKYFLFKE